MERSLAPPSLLLLTVLGVLGAGIACGGGTRPCKQETLFVTLTFTGTAADADRVSIGVSIGGGAAQRTERARTPGASTDSFEINFPNGYPADRRVDVDVVALANGAAIGTGAGGVSLPSGGCETLPIEVRPGTLTGGGGAGGTAARGGSGGSSAGAGGASGRSGASGSAAGSGGSAGATGGSAAGRGGTGGSAGSAAGRGGSSGGAGGTGGPPPCGQGNFDTSADGFSLNIYNTTPGHLLFREGGPPASVEWKNSEGNPAPGAMKIDAPFDDYNQYVDLTRSFGMTDLRNWAGNKLHVRVKIATGLDHSPQSPPGVQVYANSYNVGTNGLNYYYHNSYTPVSNAHGWADYVLDIVPDGSFDPTKITSFGVMIQTGNGMLAGGGVNPVKPTNAVVYVDSFWLEGACTPANCAMGLTATPAAALITDFSDAVPDTVQPGDFRYGSGTNLHGGAARFASGTRGTLSLSAGALTFGATVEAPNATYPYPWNGFALYVDGPACLNAGAYTGVAFTLTGLSGTCTLDFSFSDADHNPPSSDPDRGICLMSGCLNPAYTVNASTAMVAFNATPMVTGTPATPPNRAKFTGIQFVFKTDGTNGCNGQVTIDNVRFY